MEKKKIVKNVLKVVLIIIAILLVILAICTARNYIIVKDLQDKVSQYQSSTNYHIKSVSIGDNGAITKMEYYRKDNKQAVFMERNLNGEISKVSLYDNGERTDFFTENKDSKIAQLNSGTILSFNVYNHLETENNWQTLLSCIGARIKSADYNGKECYIIKDFMSLTSLSFEGAEIYVNKETGLLEKVTELGTVSEREYEFDKVEDSIFAEPDISQYTLKEKE